VNEKQKEDLDNYLIQLQNDMTRIGLDYINFLSENDDYNFRIMKANNPSFQHFKEKWTDEVAGVKFDITIQIPDDGNYCKNVFNIVNIISYPFELAGASNSLLACDTALETYYSDNSGLTVGSKLYYDHVLLNLVTENYYSDGENSYTMVNGTITEINVCGRVYEHIVSYGTTAGIACASTTLITLYSEDVAIGLFSVLYTDQYLQNLAQGPYYSNGTDSYFVENGTVSNIAQCMVVYSYLMDYGNVCGISLNATFYSSDEELGIGSSLYVDIQLETPVANNNYMVEGAANYWIVEEGVIASSSVCK